MLELDARRHSGLILNLSERGMFIQTSLPAAPGTLIGIDLRIPSQSEPVPVKAAVVWRRRVSPRMTGINQSGMGLRLLSPPSSYRDLLAEILEPVLKQTKAAPTWCPTEPSEPEPELEQFVVRLSQTGGPRSRRIIVQCRTKQAACEEALCQVGEGWTILEIVKC